MLEEKRTRKKSNGGAARARALTPARRREIAKAAAASRWSDTIRNATHGDENRKLHIGDIELGCYVLDDGTRVFSQGGMLEAVSLSNRGGELTRLITRGGLEQFLPESTVKALANPIQFRPPGGGRNANGFPAEMLVDVCNALLEARQNGVLPAGFAPSAVRAETLIRAVAKVGIVALVDEVTGYQDERRKDELRALLDRYLRSELAMWAKRFPDDFYREMHRLRGWDWKSPGNSNSAVAHYTKDLVYARLAPNILEELEKRNPIVGNRRRGKHHQFLTDDVGVPALGQHLHTVVSFMKAVDSWESLMQLMDRVLPVKEETVALELMRGEPQVGLPREKVIKLESLTVPGEKKVHPSGTAKITATRNSLKRR